MTLKEQIKAAIAAHGAWKVRLKQAIENGNSDFKPDIVKLDNQCDFGKWLYSATPEVKQSSFYDAVKKLHAEFHATAGKVLLLAVTGQKAEAEKAYGLGSDYAKISALLTNEMMKWNNSVK